MSEATAATNKQVVRRLFEEAFNHERAGLVDELVAADYEDAAGARGPAAFKHVMSTLRGAFPDLRYVVEDLLAEGDRVAIRWHWTGTHRGVYRGIAPTERSFTNNGAAIFRLQGGKIVAAALETDRLGFLQQIGVVPPVERLFPQPPNPAANPAAE
jgi:steroid delta-isomerase-like uncharacterized protein